MFLMLTLPACMTVPKGIGDYDAGYVDRGIASWYGGDFHGRLTASGEIYDQFKMTAAHRLLPLGSLVRVTNAENGREVEVVINDRGPFIKGRIIDLSYTAAKQLGGVNPGILPVVVEVIQMGNRWMSPAPVRVGGQEKGNGVGLHAALAGWGGDGRGAHAWIYAVGDRSGAAYRGPLDVLLDPRRTRRMAEPAEVPEDHPDHADLVEEMAEAFA